MWLALPGPHWPGELALAITATLASGRGALAVLPDRSLEHAGVWPATGAEIVDAWRASA